MDCKSRARERRDEPPTTQSRLRERASANPYVVVLGKPQTASSRLDLTQAFDSLGATIGPQIGGLLILSAAPLALEQLRQLTPQALQLYRVHESASVKMPYGVIGAALLLLAVLIGTSRLPTIETVSYRAGEKGNDTIWEASKPHARRAWYLRLCRR